MSIDYRNLLTWISKTDIKYTTHRQLSAELKTNSCEIEKNAKGRYGDELLYEIK